MPLPPSTKPPPSMAAAAHKLPRFASPPISWPLLGFEFKDDERMNWHFIPKPRKGLTLKDMSEDQRPSPRPCSASGVSDKPAPRSPTIMSLENILKDMEKGKGPPRIRRSYYWSVFGNQAAKAPGAGALKAITSRSTSPSIDDKTVAVAAPRFLGDNPAEVKDGPRKGLRVLAEEEDMGRAFVKSLSAEQLKKALILQTAPQGNGHQQADAPGRCCRSSKASPTPS